MTAAAMTGIIMGAVGGMRQIQKVVKKFGFRKAENLLGKVIIKGKKGASKTEEAMRVIRDTVRVATKGVDEIRKVAALAKRKGAMSAAIKAAGSAGMLMKEAKRIYGL